MDADADPQAANSTVAAATPIDVVVERDLRFIFRLARNMIQKLERFYIETLYSQFTGLKFVDKTLVTAIE